MHPILAGQTIDIGLVLNSWEPVHQSSPADESNQQGDRAGCSHR
jgi:hypothetical protein